MLGLCVRAHVRLGIVSLCLHGARQAADFSADDWCNCNLTRLTGVMAHPEVWIYERVRHRGYVRDPGFCDVYNSLGLGTFFLVGCGCDLQAIFRRSDNGGSFIPEQTIHRTGV